MRAVISDFGGVLTSPLVDAFAAFQEDAGVPAEAFRPAMRAATQADGRHPLFELERGRISEREFVSTLERHLATVLGRPVRLERFSERFFGALTPNAELFAYYRSLRDRGLRLAILTNNVREWEPYWRAMLPIGEIFELVVDSAYVGVRKPEPEIYALTLARLGLAASECVFVDDLERNVVAATALGLRGVHFRDTAQAIAELQALLDGA